MPPLDPTTDFEAPVRDMLKRITFEDVEPDQPLLSARLLDSIGVVDLLVDIEKAFGVRIKLHEINPEEFDTLNQIVAKVRSYAAALA